MSAGKRRAFRMIVTIVDDGAGQTEGLVETEHREGEMPSLVEQLGAFELAKHHLQESYSEEAWRQEEVKRIAGLRRWARFKHWMGWE